MVTVVTVFLIFLFNMLYGGCAHTSSVFIYSILILFYLEVVKYIKSVTHPFKTTDLRGFKV